MKIFAYNLASLSCAIGAVYLAATGHSSGVWIFFLVFAAILHT
jgi:hypothetical protein